MQVHIKQENKTTKKKLADGWDKLAVNSNSKSSEFVTWLTEKPRTVKKLGMKFG